MDQHHSTEKILRRKRAKVWRELISEAFVELECGAISNVDFFGELRTRKIGSLRISSITTDAYDVYRTGTGIADSITDDFLVSFQTKGGSAIRQLDREAVLSPGDFAIYDSATPYHLHFANRLSQFVVQIPRKLIKEYIDLPEGLTARRVKGGYGFSQITSNFVESCFCQSPTLDDACQKQAERTFLELLSTSCRESIGETCQRPINRTIQVIKIKRFIAESLKDPKLNPQMIAAANSISVRYLQMLFEDESISPSKYIWGQRLNNAKRDLANPRMRHKSITQICFTWGFSDTAHFSRAFKLNYGLSPRAYRRSVLVDEKKREMENE